MSLPNRIDPTPLRISNNVTIQRQTPKMDFGDRMKAGIDTAAGVVANGAAIVGSIIPGGAIVSAAVSSVGQMTSHTSPSSTGAVAASYGASGVTTLGGGVNTTVGGGSTSSTGGSLGSLNMGGGSTNYIPGAGSSNVGDMNQQLIVSQQENAQMMKLQTQMQHENIVFTSVSNVLKTRHDTAKNSISNVR